MALELSVRLCDDQDLGLLARLNRQLIEDERHDKSLKLSIGELESRMFGFIRSGYRAYVFEIEGNVIGYALVNVDAEPLYLRQFFIGRDVRRQGYGSLAFRELLQLLSTNTIDVEVLAWNESGREFWRSLGFQERSIGLRFDRQRGSERPSPD